MNFDQNLVNYACGLVGLLGGVLLREMWAAVKKLRVDLDSLNEKIGREYVRRDNYRDDINEMKSMLVRIFDKLDEKADK